MEIGLTIDKAEVMEAVAQTTAYTAAKMEGAAEGTLDRISTVDEDAVVLDRFWRESCADMCQELKGLVAEEGFTDNGNPELYKVKLEVSGSFDTTLQPSMEISLTSYFVQSMAGKWYVYTNKGEAGAYADKARAHLDDVHRKAVYKKKPTRPRY